MRHPSLFWLLALLASLARGAAPAHAQAPGDVAPPPDSLQARVWLDRGEEPLLKQGDEVRVYYRTSADAYSAIFRIDTDGRVSLLFPQHPGVDAYVGGQSDYRLLFPDATRWEVREDPGVGYFFMVASPVPLDFSAFPYDPERGWDLGGVAASVYDDPYVAIDDFVAAILPDWASTPYALDFLSYDVGERHDYPRFLCYDCHGFQSYSAWDPYAYSCTSYRVVVWSDPYFIPRYRYAGTRVVFARPVAPRPRYGVTRRIPGSASAPLYRLRPAPPRTAAYKEPVRPPSRRRPSSVVPDRRPRPSLGQRPPSPGLGAPPARAEPDPSSPTTSNRSRPDATRPVPGGQPSERARPTLQRRGPAERSPAGRAGQRASPPRGVGVPPRASSVPRPSTRAVPSTPPRPPSRARPAPTRRPAGSARTGGAARGRPPVRAQPAPARGPGRAGPPRTPPSRPGGPVRSGPTRRRGGGSGAGAPPSPS